MSKIKNEEKYENQNDNDNNHCHDHNNDVLCNKKYKLIQYYNATIDKTYIRLDVNEEAVNQEIIEEVIDEIIEEVVLEEYRNAILMNIMSLLNGIDSASVMDSASVLDSASVIDSESVMDSASVIDSESVMDFKSVNKKNKNKKNKTVNRKDKDKDQDKDKDKDNENKNESSFKSKLNLDKIKSIIDKNCTISGSNKTNLKNISLNKKIYSIFQKINTKIQTEIAKETMEYVNILQSSKKSNSNGNDFNSTLSAIYYLILNKIDDKL